MSFYKVSKRDLGFILGCITFLGILVSFGFMYVDVWDLLDYQAIPPVRDLTGDQILADRFFWFVLGSILGMTLFVSGYLLSTKPESKL